MTVESFTPAVGSRFAIPLGDAPAVELELLEARPLGERTPGAARDPFALVFAGPGDRALAQATWPLRHPALGELAIFLVPVGMSDGRLLYEAVFS